MTSGQSFHNGSRVGRVRKSPGMSDRQIDSAWASGVGNAGRRDRFGYEGGGVPGQPEQHTLRSLSHFDAGCGLSVDEDRPWAPKGHIIKVFQEQDVARLKWRPQKYCPGAQPWRSMCRDWIYVSLMAEEYDHFGPLTGRHSVEVQVIR